MRLPISALVLAPVLGIAACAPQVPNSAPPQGVGFGSYADEAARREAMLEGRPLPLGPVISSERLDDNAVASGNSAGLSDEQSFSAVSERETIESDAERLARQRAAYEVVQPEAVPSRPKSYGPNIVEYALNTTNTVGQAQYKRSPINAEARFARACGQYTSADLAQEAFLEMGGPQNDRKGMDPDGDGFACRWDPAPFRSARR